VIFDGSRAGSRQLFLKIADVVLPAVVDAVKAAHELDVKEPCPILFYLYIIKHHCLMYLHVGQMSAKNITQNFI
jgi:hypothetical protein